MLRVTPDGAVTRLDFSRQLFGRPLYWTTAYYLDGTLIDTGCRHTAPELLEFLQDKPVSQIIATHRHEDHIGGCGAVQARYPQVKLYAPGDTLDVLADPHNAMPLQPYRRFIWGWPETAQGELLREGDVVETGCGDLQVIATPGHTPDHLALFQPEHGWLFTGDLFVGGKDRALGAGSDIWGIIASLEKIAQLDAAVLYPGSARVRRHPAEALAEKIAYLKGLAERILALHEQGKSERQIVRQVCGPTMQIEWVTGGHFSRRHLVRSYLRKG